MKVHIVQPYYRIADFDEIFNILQEKKYEEGITVFPELFLTGYPLQDLCLQKSFINRYQNLLKRINEWSESQPEDKDTLILLGGLEYEFDDSGNPIEIQNVVFALEKGKNCVQFILKRFLQIMIFIMRENILLQELKKEYYTGKIKLLDFSFVRICGKFFLHIERLILLKN